MANLNVNKVIYGGDVLIDLTGDSVSADKILKGITAHDKSGAKISYTAIPIFERQIQVILFFLFQF